MKAKEDKLIKKTSNQTKHNKQIKNKPRHIIQTNKII